MKAFVWHILVCFALAVSAWAANTVDAEQFAKEIKASFHWFPVQKTFILAGESDTLKFAIGLPFVNTHGKSVEIKHAPEISGSHILLDSADVATLLNAGKAQTAAVAPASSSSLAKASSSSVKVAAAPAAAAPAKTTPVAAPKNETAGTREVKTIVIDPGHGGKDTGAQGKNSNEKELEKEGFKVKMTRDKDVFIELGERANLANQWDGDLFISLHCNAIDASPERKKQIKGYHVYVLRAPESEEDKAIARRENKVATLYGEKNAKEELSPLEWFKLEARLEKYKQNSYMFTEQMLKAFDDGKIKRQGGGVGGAGFMVLVGALMPAVLFEIGFISNPEEEAYMITSKAQADIAARISKAVSSYKEAVHNYRETLGRQ